MSPFRSRRALPAVVGGAVVVAVLASASHSQGATTKTAVINAAPRPAHQSSTVTKAPPRAAHHAFTDVHSTTVLVTEPGGAGTVGVPAGFPSASSTGVPVGTRLHVIHGGLTVTKAGSVIADVEIEGCVVIHASHVTIRDSKIVCSKARPVLDIEGASTGTILDRVELDGAGIATMGLAAKKVVATGLNIHDTGDGAHLGRNVVIQDSYVHDLAHQLGLHHDALQTNEGSGPGDIEILNNTLQAFSATSNANSVYHLGSGPISNVLVSGNYMDGGHYTVQVGNSADQHGIVFIRNQFGHHYHFGILYTGNKGHAVSFSLNTWQGTGGMATPSNSRGQGLLH